MIKNLGGGGILAHIGLIGQTIHSSLLKVHVCLHRA